MRLLIGSLILCIVTADLYAAGCEISGCNGELCVPTNNNSTILSTCLWKAEYQCYSSFGICEADASGQCHWRQTPELNACIEQSQKDVANTDRFSD